MGDVLTRPNASAKKRVLIGPWGPVFQHWKQNHQAQEKSRDGAMANIQCASTGNKIRLKKKPRVLH